MTQQAQVIAKLRQVRDLERLCAAIEAHGAAGEWATGLWALREQERWLRLELSLESSLMLDMAADIVDATPDALRRKGSGLSNLEGLAGRVSEAQGRRDAQVSIEAPMPDLPKGSRVH